MSDTQLLGQKIYDTFAATWRARETAGGDAAPLATQICDQRKIILSNQQLKFSWRNSEQLDGQLIEAVTALKNEPGGDIAISGSISIIRQLLDAELIDELHRPVDPIVVRDGVKLFADDGTTLPLALVGSRSSGNGAPCLFYGPAKASHEGTYREASGAMRCSLRCNRPGNRALYWASTAARKTPPSVEVRLFCVSLDEHLPTFISDDVQWLLTNPEDASSPVEAINVVMAVGARRRRRCPHGLGSRAGRSTG